MLLKKVEKISGNPILLTIQNEQNKQKTYIRMSEQQNSYRQIFKATSIFGGVQFVSILISILRSKFIAILLGSSGIGIMSLLQTGTDLIANVTNLGLSTSAIRDISEAKDSNDSHRIARTLTSFRRLLWLTGLLGMVTTLLLSPWLSQWVFGNKEYTWSFIILSVTLLLNAQSNGKHTLLQGMRKTKWMAQGGIFGGIIGLIISIPIYYMYGVKGIVPTMILTAVSALLLNWYYTRHIHIESVNIPFITSLKDGGKMIKLGILITLSGFISMLTNYFITIYISRTGSLSDLGLFQSGFNIANKYVGLVFTAITVDFYPRLAGINKDNLKVKTLVNQQTELTLLIIAPLLVLLLSTTPLVIQLFYTKEFLPTVPYMQWIALGLIFRALSWMMGFIVLAKGDSMLYFYKELIMNIITLICNIAGYKLGGLEGLGIAFMITNILVFTYVYWLVNTKYEYSVSKDCQSVFLTQFIICIIAFLSAKYMGFPVAYISGSLFLLISIAYSYVILNKKIDLQSYLNTKLKRK